MPKYTIEFDDSDTFHEHARAVKDCQTKTELLDEIYNLSRSINKHGGTPEQIDSGMERIQRLAHESSQPSSKKTKLIVVVVIAIFALITQYFILTH